MAQVGWRRRSDAAAMSRKGADAPAEAAGGSSSSSESMPDLSEATAASIHSADGRCGWQVIAYLEKAVRKQRLHTGGNKLGKPGQLSSPRGRDEEGT